MQGPVTLARANREVLQLLKKKVVAIRLTRLPFGTNASLDWDQVHDNITMRVDHFKDGVVYLVIHELCHLHFRDRYTGLHEKTEEVLLDS